MSRDRKKLNLIISNQKWNVWETIKELIDNYENSKIWLKEEDLFKSFNHIQYNIWSNKTSFKRSWKKWLNFYDLKNKVIHLEDKCFEPFWFVPETLWLLIHETLHSYFSKWKEWTRDFIFDKEKNKFSEVVNIFEDFRINSLSWSFIFYWQEIIKSIYSNIHLEQSKSFDFNSISEENLKKNKYNSLKNYSLAVSVQRIWWTMFDKDLINFYELSDKIKSIFPNECSKILEFVNSIVRKYWTYSKIEDKIKETFTNFVYDIYENIYQIFKDSLEEDENNQEWNENERQDNESKWIWWLPNMNPFDQELEESNESEMNSNSWSWDFNHESKESWEDGEINKENFEKVKNINETNWKNENWQDKKQEKKFQDENKINEEDWIDDYLNNFSKQVWSKIDIHKERKKEDYEKKYDEIARKNSHIIWELYTKLFTILQNKKDTITTWFDKWRTIDWNSLMKNQLKILWWSLRKDQLFKWSFKRQNKEWKKVLNVFWIWLDDSWSMLWDPMKTVIESSVIIFETLKKLSIWFCSSSFIWKIFDWRKDSLDYKKVSNLKAEWCNYEIWLLDNLMKDVWNLVKRSISYEEINCVYILITDWFCNIYDINNIKERVERIKKNWNKVIVLWIFEHDYDKKQTIKNFENLYWKWNFKYLNDVNLLPETLITIIKNNFK